MPRACLRRRLPSNGQFFQPLCDGVPLTVSGNVFYKVVNAKRASIDIEGGDVDLFVRNMAMIALKQVVGQFSYEGGPTTPALKSDPKELSRALKSKLTAMLGSVGVEVLAFSLTDARYAQAIMAQMLFKQAAEAGVRAKGAIVEGAVGVADMAVRQLDEKGIALTSDDKARLATSLLTVFVSDKGPQPTLPLLDNKTT